MTECELFKTRVEHCQEPVSEHPWHHTTSFYNYICSLNQRKYRKGIRPYRIPSECKCSPGVKKTDQVKFTIIGNRVTKEFIYCSKLVKGISTYKWKNYQPPVIRGLTSVEWAEALCSLKINYGGLAHCLNGQVAVLYNDELLGGLEELKKLIESKYIYHVCVNYRKEALNQFTSYIKASCLYSDIVPRTCENFLRLCQAEKGGYSGTPVHRIVKDGWIQCGGFGLRSTDLNCENFAIPHDRRGVLCMANDGRDIDCSTQFFVLLQPSPWMEQKYVAFGQLIEGESTLKKIEEVPSWYESPKKPIVICKSGLLNLDCQDIKINKSAFSYIQGHIEDMATIEKLVSDFLELLMERVFVEINLKELEEIGENEQESEEQATNMRTAKRFQRRKGTKDRDGGDESIHNDSDNNDFDVEDYVYEPEEYISHISSAPVSLPSKPEKLFYIPLTDVPYPGEVDSTHDLKKFLRGDFCLESDLGKKYSKEKKDGVTVPVISDTLDYLADQEEETEVLDSDDELEIKEYLQAYGEQVSFAGKTIREIAKGARIQNLEDSQQRASYEHFIDSTKMSIDLSTRYPLKEAPKQGAQKSMDNKRDPSAVRIIAPDVDRERTIIKRRTTEFVRAADVRHFDDNGDDDDDDDDDQHSRKGKQDRGASFDVTDHARPSVMVRLYEDVKLDDDESAPTLKDYRPLSEGRSKNPIFLTKTSFILHDDDITKEKPLRPSIVYEEDSFENVMSMRHARKASRKMSLSGNVKHANDRVPKNSLRTLEYAKTRPTLTISEYQLKNQRARELIAEGKLEK